MSAALQIDIFQRILESDNRRLTLPAARAILALKFSDDDIDRMNVLSAKAREGSLSKAEDDELEDYIHVGNLLAIMQSKSRRVVKKTPVRR